MFLLMTLGSLGDFMPFLALADRLRHRGHRVVIASNAGYAAMAQAMGVEFAAIWQRSDQSLDGLIARDPARAWQVVREQMFLPAIAPAQACIRHHTKDKDCTVLAAWTVLGAHRAWQQSPFPLATLYLSPAALAQDEHCEVGESRIGLFPEWFAKADDMAQSGFAMLDEALLPPLPSDLEAFLRQGPAPVLFTPGSYMRGADRFFRHSLAACESLGLRAIFLTPYPEQLPALPPHIRHYRYVPLDRLAPRALALVHHGGIGTCAAGLRAGIPQLVSPLFFDQPDNGERLKALGVGEVLVPKAYEVALLSEKLGALLQSQTTKENCSRIAGRFDGNGTDRLCAMAEALA
jgi:UDP:flavonoid glycosyltransferase YjiC (YdhE family)